MSCVKESDRSGDEEYVAVGVACDALVEPGAGEELAVLVPSIFGQRTIGIAPRTLAVWSAVDAAIVDEGGIYAGIVRVNTRHGQDFGERLTTFRELFREFRQAGRLWLPEQ